MNDESNDSQSNIIDDQGDFKNKNKSIEESIIKHDTQCLPPVVKASEFTNNNFNFLNDEDQDKTSQINEKNKKFSFFEQNMKYKLKINIDYSDIDKQKSEISPKMLFKKRKLEAYENSTINNEDKNNNLNNNLNQSLGSNNQKINAKLKQCFERYLDFVHYSYFSSFENMINTNTNQIISNQNQSQNVNYDPPNTVVEENEDTTKTMGNFRFSSLDLLINPLRQKFPFESWSPYEVALFECCICKYNKSFDMFSRIVNNRLNR